jgi:tRNA A37 threonylcarbamoyladenosine synthetase subunit TsaC/SUA5/YrdC
MNDYSSFKEIYELKKRGFDKPFSLVVKNYEDLRNFIEISDAQITFLKKLKTPFTVLWEKTKDFSLPEFLDQKMYSRLAIRVAEACIGPEFINEFVYPMFLTSANVSWNEEIYDSNDLSAEFSYNSNLKIYDAKLNPSKPSDIFNFKWDTMEIEYLRKCH